MAHLAALVDPGSRRIREQACQRLRPMLTHVDSDTLNKFGVSEGRNEGERVLGRPFTMPTACDVSDKL